MTPNYNVGDRIRLLEMPNDPDPIPVGSTGIVTRINHFHKNLFQADVAWELDPPRSLALVECDRVEVIS